MCAAPSDILCELGVRAYSGSRDVPSNPKMAQGFFKHASQNASTDDDLLNIDYFHT